MKEVLIRVSSTCWHLQSHMYTLPEQHVEPARASVSGFAMHRRKKSFVNKKLSNDSPCRSAIDISLPKINLLEPRYRSSNFFSSGSRVSTFSWYFFSSSGLLSLAGNTCCNRTKIVGSITTPELLQIGTFKMDSQGNRFPRFGTKTSFVYALTTTVLEVCVLCPNIAVVDSGRRSQQQRMLPFSRSHSQVPAVQKIRLPAPKIHKLLLVSKLGTILRTGWLWLFSLCPWGTNGPEYSDTSGSDTEGWRNWKMWQKMPEWKRHASV